jgi:hypothetical protein
VANKVGLNEFVWDMRYPDAVGFRGLVMWAGSVRGPLAVPGAYAVRMTVNGQSETRRFRIVPDPRVRATSADYAAQFALLERIRAKLSEANDAVRTIRNVRAQVEARRASAPAAFAAAADRLLARLGPVEDSIYQTQNRSSEDPLNFPIRLNNKIAALGGAVGSADARPTAQSYAVFAELSRKLDVQLAKLKAALAEDLPAVNAALASAGEEKIVPSTAEVSEK